MVAPRDSIGKPHPQQTGDLWKQVGQGTYVVGLEPANCRPEGRSVARQRGVLVELAPGERRDYFLDMSILTGKAAGFLK